MAQAEMLKKSGLQEGTLLYFLANLVTLPLSFITLFQLCTEVGIVHWLIVTEKYLIFFLVSAGIWTDQCVAGYDLMNAMNFTLGDVDIRNDDFDVDYTFRGILEMKKKLGADVKDLRDIDYIFQWSELSDAQRETYRLKAKENTEFENSFFVTKVDDDLRRAQQVQVLTEENEEYKKKVEELTEKCKVLEYEIKGLKDNTRIAHGGKPFLTSVSKKYLEEDSSDEERGEDCTEYINLLSFFKSRVEKWSFQSKSTDIVQDRVEKTDEGRREGESVDVIQAMIGPRTILLLIVPYLVPFSVFALGNVSSPLFLVSKNARKYFTPWFISLEDIMDRASGEEKSDGNFDSSAKERNVYWTVYVKAMDIFWKKSRAIQVFGNMFEFVLSIAILYGDVEFWLMLSVGIMFTFIFFQNIDVYIWIGRKMEINDYDFLYLYYLLNFAYYQELKGLPATESVSQLSEEHKAHGNVNEHETRNTPSVEIVIPSQQKNADGNDSFLKELKSHLRKIDAILLNKPPTLGDSSGYVTLGHHNDPEQGMSNIILLCGPQEYRHRIICGVEDKNRIRHGGIEDSTEEEPACGDKLE